MTAVILATLTLTAAGATRTKTADAKSTDWASSAKYWHGAAMRQRHRADNLQRRLTLRVLQVNELQRQVRRVLKAKLPPARDVSYAIHLAATVYGVSEYEMHRVASCESGHYALATNGQYRGVFQEGPMFERGPFGRAGFSVWDPVANAMTAAETVRREGWSQWTCRP